MTGIESNKLLLSGIKNKFNGLIQEGIELLKLLSVSVLEKTNNIFGIKVIMYDTYNGGIYQLEFKTIYDFIVNKIIVIHDEFIYNKNNDNNDNN